MPDRYCKELQEACEHANLGDIVNAMHEVVRVLKGDGTTGVSLLTEQLHAERDFEEDHWDDGDSSYRSDSVGHAPGVLNLQDAIVQTEMLPMVSRASADASAQTSRIILGMPDPFLDRVASQFISKLAKQHMMEGFETAVLAALGEPDSAPAGSIVPHGAAGSVLGGSVTGSVQGSIHGSIVRSHISKAPKLSQEQADRLAATRSGVLLSEAERISLGVDLALAMDTGSGLELLFDEYLKALDKELQQAGHTARIDDTDGRGSVASLSSSIADRDDRRLQLSSGARAELRKRARLVGKLRRELHSRTTKNVRCVAAAHNHADENVCIGRTGHRNA